MGNTGESDYYSSGIKRYAEMPIYSYDNQFIYALDTADDQNLCSGDSGGAALEDNGGGNYELAGVNSFVFAYSSYTTCEGGGSGATRVDRNIDFIEDYVNLDESGGSSDSGSSDSSGGSVVPDPVVQAVVPGPGARAAVRMMAAVAPAMRAAPATVTLKPISTLERR